MTTATAPATDESTRPAGRRTLRRLGLGALLTVAAVLTSTGMASAANYDDLAGEGLLRTPSRAVATANLQCGRSGSLVVQSLADFRPQYFTYRATSYSGLTTGWTSWQSVTGYSQQGIITAPGYWYVEVAIAHWDGRAWNLDVELAPVTEQPPGWSNRYWCKVTG